MRVVRGNAKTIRCCRHFLVASFQQRAPETDGPSLSGGSGFQWEMRDLRRHRFNVWKGLDLLDAKNLQRPNRLKFLPELLLHQLNYHVLAVDSRAPQRSKSPIKKPRRGELKRDAGTLRTSVPDESCGLTGTGRKDALHH